MGDSTISLDDSDFEEEQFDTPDKNEEVFEDDIGKSRKSKTNAGGKKVRGPDIAWLDLASYDSSEEYFASDMKKLIDTDYYKRKERECEYGVVKTYTCKFWRKAGFLSCDWQLKVTFLSTSEAVVVEKSVDIDESEHAHSVDPEYQNVGAGFRWTKAQSDIIASCIRSDTKPKVILRCLRDTNAFDGGPEPKMIQLYNKKYLMSNLSCKLER